MQNVSALEIKKHWRNIERSTELLLYVIMNRLDGESSRLPATSRIGKHGSITKSAIGAWITGDKAP